MLRKTATLAALAMSMGAAAAQAGGYTAPVVAAEPVAPVMAPVAVDGAWTGFYAGLNYLRPDGDLKYSDDTKSSLAGNGYGVHAGYLHDMGQWVLGGEVSWNKLSGMKLGSGGDKHDGDMLHGGILAGYDAGRVLPYVTVGAARASIDGIGTGGDNASASGWYAGIGAKFKVTDRVMVGAEVAKHEFKDFAQDGDKWDPTTIGLSVSYKF